jgi:transposase InsO family protein
MGSDRAGEYYVMHALYGQIHGHFAKFLEENGVAAQYSMPGEPPQNGVAKCRNRTLMHMVHRTLIH